MREQAPRTENVRREPVPVLLSDSSLAAAPLFVPALDQLRTLEMQAAQNQQNQQHIQTSSAH